MKIIFLEAVQNFGGSKRSIIELASQLGNLGHSVLIVDFWGANKEFIEVVRNKNIQIRILEPQGRPFFLNKKKYAEKLYNIIFYAHKRLVYKYRFKNIAKEFDPDYVCVNSAKTLDILSKSGGYAIDYHAHGWVVGNSLKERYLVRKYSPRFIAISEATRHALMFRLGVPLDRVKILKLAVAESSLRAPRRCEKRSFGPSCPIAIFHAGTFIETKGQHVVLAIARTLKMKGISFRVKLAGIISPSDDSKQYFNSLKRMVFEYGLQEHVEFLVNNNNLENEMELSDIFLYPSYTEGLPRVCLEAMSKGLPIISNPVGGVIDFLVSGYNGYLVSYNCVDEFVERVEEYYNSYELCVNHGRNSIDILNSGYLKSSYTESLKKIYKI